MNGTDFELELCQRVRERYAELIGDEIRATLYLAVTFYQESGKCLVTFEDGSMTADWVIPELRDGLEKTLENWGEAEAAMERESEIISIRASGGHFMDKATPKPSQSGSRGYVYFLKADNGLVKIGRTKEMDERIKHLSVTLPYELELVHYIQSDNHEWAESVFQRYYAGKRVRGEWFELADKDVENIGAVLCMDDWAYHVR